MIFVGIDPGVTGAVAIIDRGEITILDAPSFNTAKPPKENNFPDVSGYLSFLETYKGQDVLVAVELVHAIVNSGVVANFKLASSYYAWLTALAALKLPHTTITPQAWKKALMYGHGKEKEASRMVAMQLFPQVAEQLKRKMDHNRAEALLIAEFSRRMHEKPAVKSRSRRKAA